MFFKRPQHRVFDYTPRYYKPENDPAEKRKQKLNFRSGGKKYLKKNNKVYLFIITFIVVLFFYLRFQGII